jgi:hypothetical protein
MTFPVRKPRPSFVFIEGLQNGQSAEKTCARIAHACTFLERIAADGEITVCAKRTDGAVFRTYKFPSLGAAISATKPFRDLMFKLGKLAQYSPNLKAMQASMVSHKDVADNPLFELIEDGFVKQAIEACSDNPKAVLRKHNREISQMVSLSQGH